MREKIGQKKRQNQSMSSEMKVKRHKKQMELIFQQFLKEDKKKIRIQDAADVNSMTAKCGLEEL